MQNARDIIACGFDIKKTFIYSDLKYVGGHLYMNAIEFARLLPFNQVRGAFGFNERSVAWLAMLLLLHYTNRLQH